jgi:Fatty acid hydroxylase
MTFIKLNPPTFSYMATFAVRAAAAFAGQVFHRYWYYSCHAALAALSSDPNRAGCACGPRDATYFREDLAADADPFFVLQGPRIAKENVPPGPALLVFMFFTVIPALLAMWGIGQLFYAKCVEGRAWSEPYRVQKAGQAKPPSREVLGRAYTQLLVDSIQMVFIAAAVGALFYLEHPYVQVVHSYMGGFSLDVREIPSDLAVFLRVVLCFLAEDFTFYVTHRALHTPWLYKRVHKMHHQFYTPSAGTLLGVTRFFSLTL